MYRQVTLAALRSTMTGKPMGDMALAYGDVLAAWRQALDRRLLAKDERAVLFNCANGNKYPLPDRSRRMKLTQMDAAL